MNPPSYIRPFLSLVAFTGGLLFFGASEVAGFGFLDSLSPLSLPKVSSNPYDSSSTKTTTTTTTMMMTGSNNYLDSLQPSDQSTATTAAGATAVTDWTETIAETPDNHYAKDHPGAGWAGYKHPMYGGYLENLSSERSTSSSNHVDHQTAPAAPTMSACVLETGKKADYGDDIRWGAQVYLDNLN